MGVLLRRPAMRGPARMANAECAVERLETNDFFQITQLAFGAAYLQSAVIAVAGHSDAGRIISAVFESPQPVDNDRDYALFANISYDSAHRPNLSAPAFLDVE